MMSCIGFPYILVHVVIKGLRVIYRLCKLFKLHVKCCCYERPMTWHSSYELSMVLIFCVFWLLDLLEEKFYFIGFQYMVCTQDGIYLPLEYGIVEWSMAKGVTKTIHGFINPGQLLEVVYPSSNVLDNVYWQCTYEQLLCAYWATWVTKKKSIHYSWLQ